MGLPRSPSLLFIFLFALSFQWAAPANAESPGICADRALHELLDNGASRIVLPAEQPITPEKLATEIAARRSRVPEFEFIKQEAEKRGLRVWLFGGTGAGYAHYVKWDLLRELGDTSFQPERFDYDYTNIYRSTQDLDIVVDGSAKQAQEFEQSLKTQFPYFLGSKANAWEVRSLREPREDKGAILGDHNFMNQHTDSNSTGMVELTDPPHGESVVRDVRDVRDWNNSRSPQFFQDVLDGKLHYYYSDTHETTERYLAGKNPPIFAAIRYLTKAFQYNLKMRPEDIERIQKVVSQFDPRKDLANQQAAFWIEKNGKKLFQHAVNLEYAWKTLEELGLRQKLLGIKNNPGEVGSLSWWMNKEPLRSAPVGLGQGRTAAELGVSEVAHETGDFLAYESITRAHTGEPNLFISRQNAAGEAAAYGNGFYSAIGKKGARGTGITIRFKVNPQAREGTDFVSAGNFVIFRNRNAIEVIPESLKMSPLDYFEFLSKGETISQDDQALLWKLKRKLDHTAISGKVSPEELSKIRNLVLDSVEKNSPNQGVVLQEWIAWKGARLKRIPDVGMNDALRTMADRSDLEPLASLEKMFRGSDVAPWMEEKLFPAIFAKMGVQAKGERALALSLFSSQPALREFGVKLLNDLKPQPPGTGLRAVASNLFASQPEPSLRQSGKIFAQIVGLKRPEEHDFEGALSRWLKSPETTVDQKAEFLLTQFGTNPTRYREIKNALPVGERSRVEEQLEKMSVLPVFEKLARERGVEDYFQDQARFESLTFVQRPANRSFKMGDGKAQVTLSKPIEIQAAPVTQLEYSLVMGKNPSSFTQEGRTLNIKDGQGTSSAQIDANRPVEQVSWDDAQEFIKKLNALDPHYNYRLPTEAEWEEAARGGTSTNFSHGDNEKELKRYGWYSENAGNKTQPVASLGPNPYGLYDTSGNVWEWTQDWYGNVSGGKDPVGPSGGLYRVFRGGGWGSSAEGLRSGYRSYRYPSRRRYDVGFRLVRTPK